MGHVHVNTRRLFLAIPLLIVSFCAAAPSMAESQAKLPDTMLWSCYDVGSTGYIHASAMADALLKKQGTKIRLTPSGTSIGRLMPLKAKRVDVGWLATEAFFAAEGTYDFASYDWGPQDVRTFLAFPTAHAVIVTKESGIKTLKDLKGKKVSWIPGNPSLNVKMTAYLAFAGLTWDDVVKVDFANYGATMKGIIEGKVDAVCGTATAGLAYELASTPRGISYPPFPPDDKEAWKRMLKVAPFLTPYKETVGAGLSEENAVQLVQYRYPVGTVYADADPEMVYNLVKALDQTFPLYEKSAPKMEWWAIDKAGVPPADAPFHDGAIRYLKERGVWTAEHQAWNDKGVARIQELRKLWDKLVPEAKAKSMNDEAFADFWMKEQTKVE